MHQEIIKVDRAILEQLLLIEGIHLCDVVFVARQTFCGERFRRNQAVLVVTDAVGQGTERNVRQGEPRLFDCGSKRSCGIVGIVDAEVVGQTKQAGISPQHSHTKTVEGAHPQRRIAHELLQPIAHLFGSFIGERQRKNRRGSTPCSIMYAMRWVTTRVLPLPVQPTSAADHRSFVQQPVGKRSVL